MFSTRLGFFETRLRQSPSLSSVLYETLNGIITTVYEYSVKDIDDPFQNRVN